MKILNVITELWSPAGTTQFVIGAANALSCLGEDVYIAIRDLDFPNQTMPSAGVKVLTISEVLSSRGDEKWDVVHIHGIWNYPLHRVVSWARKRRIPIVFSPHGMMTKEALRFKRWKKILPWYIYQRRDCASAQLWHVTTTKEEQDVRRCGFSQPCVVCPLGVDVPDISVRHNTGIRNALFLSRVHKTKGVEDLLRAWSKMPHPGWRLTIAGPCDESYKRRLTSIVGDDESVRFSGEVYGREKIATYMKSDIFVLPTHTENFGVVIAEAMACGVPVITTHGAPWGVLENINAGYWVPIGSESLNVALVKMMSLSDQDRAKMGQNGRSYVKEKYSWDRIVLKLRDGYRSIVE